MPEARRVHLSYLEGIRGWAAVFVTLHHIWQFVVMRPDFGVPPRWFTLLTVFKFGGYAVPVFIVLSGYCLMLPVARSATTEIAGGIRQFAVRRARRILIPYYAALALVLGLLLVHPALNTTTYSQWDTALPALTTDSIVSHLFLVHNWFEQLEWRIDPPMWSVATEWQIYFVFALVLLPIWRRFGPALAVAAACAASAVALVAGYGFASPWFLGLFAFGMVGAAINFAPRMSYGPADPRTWEKVSTVLWLMAGALTLTKIEALAHPHPLPDIIVGLATTTLLIACTRRVQRGLETTLIGKVLEHPVSTKLGEFSYSIYLIHYPIIALVYVPLEPFRLPPVPMFATLLFAALPLALLVAYGFHRVFERPFMTRIAPARPATTEPAEPAAEPLEALKSAPF